MARFRLKAKHYLNVPGTEWEQKETDQATGKQVRKVYEVPLYLDPEDPSSHNYPGEVIVATVKDKAFPRDIIFVPPCSVDMEPLDEEAEAMWKEIAAKGQHPIESLPTNEDFGAWIAKKFEREADALALKVSQPDSRVSSLERQVEELKALVASLAQPKPNISIGAK